MAHLSSGWGEAADTPSFRHYSPHAKGFKRAKTRPVTRFERDPAWPVATALRERASLSRRNGGRRIRRRSDELVSEIRRDGHLAIARDEDRTELGVSLDERHALL